MQPSDFYFLMAPLAAMLFLLIPIVIYYARREEHVSKELQVLNEKRAKQAGAINDELGKLKAMYAERSIDQFTYKRFRKLLMRAQMVEAGYDHVTSDTNGKMYFRKRAPSK
jgi:hypothetical protein